MYFISVNINANKHFPLLCYLIAISVFALVLLFNVSLAAISSANDSDATFELGFSSSRLLSTFIRLHKCLCKLSTSLFYVVFEIKREMNAE